MTMRSQYSQSDEYKRFRNTIAERKVIVEPNSSKVWRYYDAGSKDNYPLIMLHGASGTAEVFYRQIISLSCKEYRIISVQYPAYPTFARFLKAFDKFIDHLNVGKVHLFGTALGGYLAQCYIQHNPTRVLSLVLCNAISETQYYADQNSFVGMFSVTPAFMLKRILMSNFPEYETEREIANSVDFMVEQLDTVSQEDLASRLTLNCTPGPLNAVDLPMDNANISIIDALDDVALPTKLKEEIHKVYPFAKQALLKTGGNFPYLSRAMEVNLHLEVHLRKYLRPTEDEKEEEEETTATTSTTTTLSTTITSPTTSTEKSEETS